MNWINALTPAKIRRQLQLSPGAVTYDIEQDWELAESSEAAVLLPFFYHLQQWHLLFIRRSSHDGDRHSGQVAFAGGKRESVDSDLVATALREAEEEIGLDARQVEVLGQLPVHHSVSRFRITPVVGLIPWPCHLAPDEREVARIFSIPLEWLAQSSHHRVREYQERDGARFPVIYFDEYDGEVLWGATARMTLSLISRLQQTI